MSDEDLVRIIRTGIPNTPMPASNMTAEQASKIVAYLRSRAAAARAGARHRRCRARAGQSSSARAAAPAVIASRATAPASVRTSPGSAPLRGALELERSLVDPAADVQANNRFYRVVMRDGTAVTGRLLSHDTFTVQLLDTKEQLRSFTKSDLREHGFADSPMPSFRNTLTPQEIADVVSYLVSLKGRG